jgi:pectate lyase
MRNVNNVIVRNMRISFVQASSGNGDAIHIDHGTHIWIDHNELFSDQTHGTDFYDGLLDCTHACDFITVSWNYLHDHIKCSLVGHSDSNASEDTGHLRMTYHHNFFARCDQRNPRVRFGNPVHVFNNYFLDITLYAIASTENAGILVEGNYFENTPDPFHLGQADSGPGTLVARNNTFVNSGSGSTGGSVASIPYSYTVDASSSVKASVMANAGVGKIST